MKEIQLSQGKVALVDEEDFGWLNQWSWHFHNGYAKRMNKERTLIRMHKVIMNPAEGMEIDHINGNKLDNRKENLRVCSHSNNGKNLKISKRNTSGYKGVSWNKPLKKWQAHIMLDGKSIYLGLFPTTEEAAHAYDAAAVKKFGEYANLNFGGDD